jgi:hypothetical protein
MDIISLFTNLQQAVPFWPLLASSAISSLAPYAIDAITGKSRAKKRAENALFDSAERDIAELNEEAGQTVTDSLLYKTAMGEANKAYKKQDEANEQQLAASGGTQEARLGMKAILNEGYNKVQTNTLAQSEIRRKQLRDQIRALRSGMLQAKLQQQQQEFANQNALAGNIGPALGGLLQNVKWG